MYAQHYQLQSDPFRLTPDPDFSFTHQSYGKAWAYMQYALRQGEGFLVITGRPGSGKTTLVRSLLAELARQRIASAVLVSTRFEAADLVPMVAHAFGLSVDGADKVTVLKRLQEFLVRHARSGHPALLLIDEAQGLSADTLQELYRLTNLYEGETPLLQVFLVGQDQLRAVLHAAGWGELRQRLIAACHLEPLDLEQTHAYIRHRLLRSGWRGNPQFSDEAVRLIHRYSEGLPRRINTMCSRLLLFGSVHDKRSLDGDDVRVVLDELREERLHVDDGRGEDDFAPTPQSAPEAPVQPLAADERGPTDIEALAAATTAPGRTEPKIGAAAWEPEPDTSSKREPAVGRDGGMSAVDEVDLHIPGPRRDTTAAPPSRPSPETFVEKPRRQGRGPRAVVLVVFVIGMLVLFRNYLPMPDVEFTRAPVAEPGDEPSAAIAEPPPQVPQSEGRELEPSADATPVSPAAPPPDAAVLGQRQMQPDAGETPISPPGPATDRAEVPPSEPPMPEPTQPTSTPPAAEITAPEPEAEAPPAAAATAVEPDPISPAPMGPVTADPAPREPATASERSAPPQAERPNPGASVAPGDQQAAAVTRPAAPAQTPADAASVPAPTNSPANLSGRNSSAQVQSLLRQAKAAMEDYRLTIPQGQSAYELYREVLRLDPQNQTARQGLSDIVQRYVWLASRSLELREYDRVATYTDRGLRLDPQNQELRALQRLLAIEMERIGRQRQ